MFIFERINEQCFGKQIDPPVLGALGTLRLHRCLSWSLFSIVLSSITVRSRPGKCPKFVLKGAERVWNGLKTVTFVRAWWNRVQMKSGLGVFILSPSIVNSVLVLPPQVLCVSSHLSYCWVGGMQHFESHYVPGARVHGTVSCGALPLRRGWVACWQG